MGGLGRRSSARALLGDAAAAFVAQPSTSGALAASVEHVRLLYRHQGYVSAPPPSKAIVALLDCRLAAPGPGPGARALAGTSPGGWRVRWRGQVTSQLLEAEE